ncbi:MAG: sensor domain-containing diguanylate cyclase [Bacillota bacterium]|nr:sensor domain-containing diguanylate cyclase [Bacillota bacterium]
MEVKPRVKRMIYIVWILLVPAGMWLTYRAYPPQITGHWAELFAFLVLYSIVASMPMVINNTPVFLIQWISLATFLIFGLFVEIVFAQIAIIVVLMKLRLTKDALFRYPLNFIMFFLVSLISGVVYYALGGKTGETLIGNSHFMWLAILYALLAYLLNQIIISLNQYYIYKIKGSFFGKDLVWETVTMIITFPLGFVLYMLYRQVGLFSLLFVGIPFASLSIILNLYYSSEKINEYLQTAAEIGHQLAEHLYVDDVLNLFIQKLGEMLPVDYAYILNVVEHKELQVVRRIENGKVMPNEDIPRLKMNEGFSGTVWKREKLTFYKTKEEWRKLSTILPFDAESVLGVPIVRSNDVVGILVLASKRKRAYEKPQLMIVDILCSHYAVAVENARHYEETKMFSERCALTNLYNYRYFDKMLAEEFEKLHHFERRKLSLIILDLDHFKNVNDTYGHQSGNEILQVLANRLEEVVGNKGTVARYGGEEFVVLLPNYQKKEAFQFAELIRQMVANHPFTLKQHIDEEKIQVYVTVTASIGIATAPEDADDSLALIRHADRALYVGAKRAGRNRVAEYTK